MTRTAFDDTLGTILIGGSPSSGSTLLSVMMDCHPQMFCGPETNIVAHPAMWRDERPVSEFFHLPATRVPLGSGVTWARPSAAGLVYHLAPLAELKAAVEGFADPLEVLKFVLKPRLALERKLVGCEKSPPNIYAIIPALERHSSLKAIATVRNAPDVIRSLLRRRSTPRNAAARWLSKLNLCREASERFGPDRLMLVRYEDLVHDPLAVAQRICQFAGVDLGGAQQMVERRSSLRFEADPSIRGESGAASAWLFRPTDPISDYHARGRSDPLPRPVIELLNSVRIPAEILAVFGATGPSLDVAAISEWFGYSTDWDKDVAPHKANKATSAENLLYAFCDELLGLKSIQASSE